jgi:lipopolysaccharide export LptBFGC system permease protein LptF
MIRATASIAIPLVIAAIALKLVMGIAVGVVFSLAWFLLKALCIAGAVYCALALISPRTAQRVREKLGVDESKAAP